MKPSDLSELQQQILPFLSTKYSYKEIGLRLNPVIRADFVERVSVRIYKLMGIASRVEFMAAHIEALEKILNFPFEGE